MSVATTVLNNPSGAARWWVYQRERFPIVGHGALILAFASGAVCFSAQLRAAADPSATPVALASLAVGFLSSFLFFFQLRVSDEFKDLDEDTRWRPYRPVPRGLVTLAELRRIAVAGMFVQAGAAAWLAPKLLPFLVLVWLYIGLMTREFWLHEFLKTRPLTVLWTHMLIMPFIDFYATACDWVATGEGQGRGVGVGLIWFLVASFFNGIVVEVGRKIRAPEDEEEGVETYSRAWGRRRAIVFWLGAVLVTYCFALLAARDVGGVKVVSGTLGALAFGAMLLGGLVATTPAPGRGKWIEVLSGLWTIALYLSVGVAPYLLQH
ncbi:MAG: UbiA family prenyltransferase [Gemmatimonadaceae bacterium]